jgi:predicted metal-dependent hydrolase
MVKQIELGTISVDVQFKDIKNLHLSVQPPEGRVTVSAPAHMTLESVRLFAIRKLGWIKTQQSLLRNQEREAPREFVPSESHFVWGKRYLMAVKEVENAPTVELEHSRLVLGIRPDSKPEVKEAVIAAWYRDLVKAEIPKIVDRWASVLGVELSKVYVRRMKTKWGSCNHKARSIRLNTELAKKPKECIDYVVLHELAHLLEPTHNARFTAIMDRAMPSWRLRRDQLNDLPVTHEEWKS